MKQFWLQMAALVIVIFGGLWVSVHPDALTSLFGSTHNVTGTGLVKNQNPSGINNGNTMKAISIVSQTGQIKAALNVEVADTDQKRALGLGERNMLTQNSGMLFLFEKEKIPQFWMKGMKFSLDMVWIKGDMIIGTTENVPPPTGAPGEVLPIYSPTVAVDKVLEVNAGFAKQHGITAGDKLQQI